MWHGSSADPPAPVEVKPFRFGPPDLVLLITGGGNGMMEVCNCSGPMPGGLARRSGLAISYRSAFPNTFLLDAGDAFWIVGDDARNEFILQGFRQIGYDAAVLGDQEWSVSLPRLRKMLVPGPTQYLSTTVGLPASAAETRATDGETVISRVVKREWLSPAGEGQSRPVKLAILSDLRRRSLLFFPEEKLREMSFSPPGQLTSAVEQLHRDGYLVAVVCHGDDEDLLATAEACSADLFIRGHTMKPQKELLSLAGRPVVKVGGSEYVGVLGIKLGPTGTIAQLEYRLELVDRGWPMDGRLIQTYQAYCHVAMREALDAPRRKGLDCVPSENCGRCHVAQYQAWRKGRHAGAYETLVKGKRNGDPACLMCHTSGFGTELGFHTFQSTPKLAGVNCQDCHRFNLTDHTEAGGWKAPRPDQNVCQACHTPVTDPGFDYKRKVPKVACPRVKAEVRP